MASDKLRNIDQPTVLGYELIKATLTPKRKMIDTSAPGDYGADPAGEIGGELMFRMVPSGDIVNWEERNRRIKNFELSTKSA